MGRGPGHGVEEGMLAAHTRLGLSLHHGGRAQIADFQLVAPWGRQTSHQHPEIDGLP